MKRKKKQKLTPAETAVAVGVAAVYLPLSVIFKLTKPKKHRHGGRWCRKY